MDSTFKNVLDDAILKVTGGNRSRTTQIVEAWGENIYEDNFNMETEYERQYLARHVYTVKMRQLRKNHAGV